MIRMAAGEERILEFDFPEAETGSSYSYRCESPDS